MKCFLEEQDNVKRRFFSNEINFIHRSSGVSTLEPHEPVFVIKHVRGELFQVLYREQVGYIILEQEEDMDSHMTQWYDVGAAHEKMISYIEKRMKNDA